MKSSSKADRFRRSELHKLSQLSYRELKQLCVKGRTKIDSPVGLEEYNFASQLHDSGNGNIKVEVYYYDLPPYPEEPKWLQDMTGSEIKVGESRYTEFFNIYEDDSIEWHYT